jgi:phosphoglycerol transferase MdoB-like AlkP superfamily enzyme
MKEQLPNWRRSRYGLAGFFILSFLAATFVLRAVLFLAFGPGGVPPVEAVKLFAAGTHRDLFVALVLTLPLLGWFLVIPNRWFQTRWHRMLIFGGFLLFWAGQSFLLAAEFFFFEEFRSRFNTVAVDYLLYPHEVFINIWDSYPVPAVVAGCAVAGAVWLGLALRLFRAEWSAPAPVGRRFAWFGGTAVLALLLSQTVSLKGARVSAERTLNEIANNGALAFVSAIWTRHLDYPVFYRTLPRGEAYQRTRKLLSEEGTEFTTDPFSLRRKIAGDAARPKLNVVVLLEESLGSEFWGSLGRPGETLTPEMDRLANEGGLLFTNIYASGNRTVRGLEGVLSSFPPLPGDSIVVRDRSENVETLARVLKRDGYTTEFLYGGRGVFDGMRSFMLGNGYDRFIELKHFPKPAFTTIWGVSDEDLFAKAIEECREMAKTGRPFFATCLSVSNHKPFTYPAGRIPENPDERKREYAVKYSDYALGQFFKAAKKEAFWTNTVFVVVADHGARVYGSQSIPIKSYEIPLLIAGPAVVKEPGRLPQWGGSLDVAPTILGLLGRPYESMFFGRDLLKKPVEPPHLVLHHNRDVGMFANDRLAVLGLRRNVEFYGGNPKRVNMEKVRAPGDREKELEKDTAALFQVADDLYIARKYRIDGN